MRSKLINETDIHFLSVAKFFKSALNEIVKENTVNLSAKTLKKIEQQALAIDAAEPSIIVNYMPYKWLKSSLKI